MTLSYIIHGAQPDSPGVGTDLYERLPEVREVYERAEQWTGLAPGRLLRWEEPPLVEHKRAGAIRQAAMTLGIHDALAARGVLPDVVAGLSLGGIIGASMIGALDRRDMFATLAHLRDVPDPPGPAQGAAMLLIAEADSGSFHAPDGAYVAMDGGPTADGKHLLIVSGYRSVLEDLAASLPEGMMRLIPWITTALHSPLYGYAKDFLERFIAGITFQDPRIPMCSCMDPGLLPTAAAVQGMFLRNQVEKVDMPCMLSNLADQGTDLAVLIGPGPLDRFPASLPFPIIQIDRADRIDDGVAEIFDMGGYAPVSI